MDLVVVLYNVGQLLKQVAHMTHKLLHVAHALTCQLEVTILQICMHGGTQALQDLARLAASAIDGWRFDFSIM